MPFKEFVDTFELSIESFDEKESERSLESNVVVEEYKNQNQNDNQNENEKKSRSTQYTKHMPILILN